MVAPTLMWAGGKRQLLDRLYDLLPSAFDPDENVYYEPFLGGGALAFDLQADRAVLNDINSRLINYYEHVRDDPEALIETLESFDPPESDPNPSRDFAETAHFGYDIEEYYYQQRALFNRRPYGYEYDELEEAALLQYLNQTCFNGLYRENQSGGFNTPIGNYENPDWVQEDRIRALSKYLRGSSVFYNTDYTDATETALPGDLVYVDPPYQPMSATEDFTEYTADGFDRDDQRDLIDHLCELRDRGVHIVASNSGVMADQYENAGFEVHTVDAIRSINSDGDSRGAVDEIIAVS